MSNTINKLPYYSGLENSMGRLINQKLLEIKILFRPNIFRQNHWIILTLMMETC